jgi:hypothetical protein
VKWFKNSMQLTDDTAMLEHNGHRHTLVLQTVSDEDYGNYTCRANNKHGEEQKILEISG